MEVNFWLNFADPSCLYDGDTGRAERRGQRDNQQDIFQDFVHRLANSVCHCARRSSLLPSMK